MPLRSPFWRTTSVVLSFGTSIAMFLFRFFIYVLSVCVVYFVLLKDVFAHTISVISSASSFLEKQVEILYSTYLDNTSKVCGIVVQTGLERAQNARKTHIDRTSCKASTKDAYHAVFNPPLNILLNLLIKATY